MRFFAVLLLALCINLAEAHDVYRWVAPDGRVHFSDQPHPGAEIITLPTFPPPHPPRYVPPPMPKPPEKPMFYRYNRLGITKPEPGVTIHNNQGTLEVTLIIDPELNTMEGHKVQILIDGRAQGGALPSLEQSLTGIERGRHTVTAQVVNKLGRVLISSGPVSFYMRRASPLFHPPVTPGIGVQQAPRAPMAPRAPRAPHSPFIPAPPPPSPAPGSRSSAG